VNTDPRSGEIWLADLGMTAKSRPVLILAYPGENDARALVIVVPLTSQIRGYRGEVEIGRPRGLSKQSAVNVQGLASIDPGRLVRKLAVLNAEQRDKVNRSLRDLLGL
jgi:mRNA interferase MazF